MANLNIFSKNQKKDREIGICVRVGRESSRQTEGKTAARPAVPERRGGGAALP